MPVAFCFWGNEWVYWFISIINVSLILNVVEGREAAAANVWPVHFIFGNWNFLCKSSVTSGNRGFRGM